MRHAVQGAEIAGSYYCLVLTSMERLKMDKFAVVMKRFMQDEDGVTAIEYGLIAALIAVVIIGSVTAVGTSLNEVFQYIADTLGAVPLP